jgi:hypothetical protein
MSIVFFCQNCGARFEVDDGAAGKQGRCKQCRQKMVVPRAGTLASLAATPHLSMAAAVAHRSTAAAPADAEAGSDWLAGGLSQAALKPLTVDRMPAFRKPVPKPSPLDDLGDSKPYAVVAAPKARRAPGAGKPAGQATILWRQNVGRVQRAFRWINETAYLISVPFIMLIFFGAMFRSRPMALFGASVVVVLNIGRIVSGLANIVAIPFRESPATGVSFLIPPFTFVYMKNHWDKMRRPTKRVIGPILTIALVVLAFTLIPSLSGKAASSGNLKGRLKSTVSELKRSIKDETEKIKDVDLNSLTAPAPAAAGPGDGASNDGPGALQRIQNKIQGATDMIRGQAGQIQEAAQPQ